ncbi:MAG: helix-turn-helix domain-containing protein [Candidatus Hadarchaeales archaeon]
MLILKERIMKWIAGDITLAEDHGERLRYWRERFGLSQTELASTMNVSPSVISDYEAGRRRSPGASTVKKIVEALLSVDEARGGAVISSLSRVFGGQISPDIVLDMQEYDKPVSGRTVVKAIAGEVVANKELLDREIYGYTVIDSLKAIMELSADDFRRLYGMTTERVLAFTKVSAGRSPMVAIRVMGIVPGMVVLHGEVKEVDQVGIKIAQLLKVPLVVSRLPTAQEMIEGLKKCSG